MAKKHVKVVVTGAAGNIGYALLFRIAAGEVFGPDVTVDLHLLEIKPALPALKGVLMELEDCAFPLLGRVLATDDANVAMKEVNWVVLVGAVPRKAGMERSDLLKINGKIFTATGRAISDHASSDVRVLVVGNPCNTNCLIAMHNAPDIPSEQFFAMTRLDQNRAQAQLAIKAGVPITKVSDMIIWGNHSSTQYPDFYNAKINRKPVLDVIQDEAWLTQKFIPIIQKRGAAVIKARGASSAASAANAIMGSLRSLYHDTPKGVTYSMAVCSQGQYQIDEGLIFSFPCQTKNGKISVVEGIKHNDFGREKLTATLQELREERGVVRKLELIDI